MGYIMMCLLGIVVGLVEGACGIYLICAATITVGLEAFAYYVIGSISACLGGACIIICMKGIVYW